LPPETFNSDLAQNDHQAFSLTPFPKKTKDLNSRSSRIENITRAQKRKQKSLIKKDDKMKKRINCKKVAI
jgi:hypothetical protein